MRILYLSQYFPPEIGATQTRAYEMAKKWVELGHSVTMLTEFPNHPSGLIPGEYKGKLFERVTLDGIDVIRVWVKASSVKNFRSRMMFYLSYMLSAILFGLFLIDQKYDFIYVTSPPLFVGGAGLVLSKIKRLKFVFEVRDLWPESAIELGELKIKLAISFSTKLEEACYNHASLIVVVTRGIFDRLISRNISPKKIYIAPNGSNLDLFRPQPLERDRLRKELGIEDKLIVIYAGIHGLAQGLETIIDTAQELQNISNIHFVLIGDGPKKSEILELIRKYELTNISMLSEQPRETMPSYFSMADVSLVPLRKIEIFKGALPSKIFDSWACKIPVIISIDGEARELVEKAGGGLYVPPENHVLLSELIRKLANAPEILITMGKNGFEYTQINHSRQVIAEKLITHLEAILST